MPFLTLSHISKQAQTGFLLKDISFTQKRFQKVAIAGETGAGKSTLLKIIAGLIQPDTGEIQFEDKTVTGPDENLVPGHPAIAYLSQHFELPKSLRVEQVLSYANKRTDEEASIIYEVCLIKHLLLRRTDQLSGGEKQRIALAKLLIASPKLLLLDEPFSNLDRIHKTILQSVINNIGKKLKITCMLISHDAADILSWADQILVMRNGNVVQQGSPEEIYKTPVDVYTANLFGKANVISRSKAEVVFGIKTNIRAKRILIRPEDLKLVNKNDNSIGGIVKEVSFYGSHYEVTILFSKTRVVVKTNLKNIFKGDAAFVAVDVNELWYF